MKIEHIFQVLIVIFIAAGIYFWTAENKDGIFVCFALASVSFFMSFRFKAKGRMEKLKSQNLKGKS